MGWLEGLLTGYADNQTDIRKEKARQAELAADREGKIYQLLLNSDDPFIKTSAMTGLLQSGQPLQRKGGFAGWMGEMQANPAFPKLMKYINTPQLLGDDVKTTVTTPQQAGYLPTLPDTSKPAAQTTAQTTTPGAPPPASPQATPSAGPPPPPAMMGVAGVAPDAAGAPSPDVAPPPVPPEMLASVAGPSSVAPTGFGDTTPPPAPPPSIGQLGPDQLRGALPPSASAPESLRQTTHTPVYGLPHVLPSAEESEIAKARAGEYGQFLALRDAFQRAGDPNPDKHAADTLAAKAARASGLAFRPVNLEWTDPDTGKPVQGLGMIDEARGRYVGADGVSPVPYGAHEVAKTGTGGGAITAATRALQAMGFNSIKQVPPEKMDEYRDRVGVELRADASNRAGGTFAGRYAEELAHVNHADVENKADLIARDISLAGPLLAGRSQAYRDEISKAITKGRASTGPGDPGRQAGNVTKITEATRQMAETAKDILPVMKTIADDAQEFDKLGMMGPVAGRWQDFMTGKVGVTELGGDPKDPNYAAKVAIAGKFRTEVDLLQKAVLRAHAGARGAGSPEGLEKMEGMLNAAHMDLGTFLSSMSGFKVWMDQYAKHLPDFGTPGQEPDPNAPPAPEPLEVPVADPNAHIGAMSQKYTAWMAAHPEAAPGGAPPVATPAAGTLSPQFTQPMKFDPKTGRRVP